MQISRADRVRMERAHVRAWPALRTADIDGWLWRSSGGGSQRANSVSTIDFSGNDLQDAIAKVEASYFGLKSPVLFQTFDDTSPPDLPDALEARGYRRSSTTLTMVKFMGPDADPANTAYPADVKSHDVVTEGWLEVYLNAITEDRRSVNSAILQTIPGPSAYFSKMRDGSVISTALCVVSFGCAVIECVATRFDARRQGAARDVLAGLQSWAAQQKTVLLGLQVDAKNEAAIALYHQLGFRAASTNCFWLLGSDSHRSRDRASA